MYFRDYRLSKTWLNHSLKTTISEDPLAVNMWKGPKHLWNHHERSFIIHFGNYEGKWLMKYLSYGNLKSQRCLLTHWLPMRTISLGIQRICSSQFKCSYLKNKKLFLNIFFDFWNLHQISNIFKQRWLW